MLKLLKNQQEGGGGSSDEDNRDSVTRDIEFTVDEDIYEKTGVKRPRLGEELDGLASEKIYRYQLEQDIEKINKWGGTYKSKIEKHEKLRNEDVVYKFLNDVPRCGENAKFNEVSSVTREISWRSTRYLTGEIHKEHLQQPPIIAYKRYQEWLYSKPNLPPVRFGI